MEISVLTMTIAAVAGVIGTMIGGTEAFIVYGFVVIIQAILTKCGVDLTTYNAYCANLFFLPAVMFNAAVPATGYAAMKHDKIRAWETSRSLAFAHDAKVGIVGALAAMGGYLVFAVATNMGLPCDTGALSVCTIALISRLIFKGPYVVNPTGTKALTKVMKWDWEILIAAAAAFASAFFVKLTGLVSIGFALSAVSLLFMLLDGNTPATHHITMVAGYAVMATGNIFIAVLFGILAAIINNVFGAYFNTGNGTHFDPPAVAILTCSLIIMTLF